MKLTCITIALAATGFASAAHATTIEDLLSRNAVQQARIVSEIAAGRIDPLRAAQIERRAADVYRREARSFAGARVDGVARASLVQAQRDLAGAIAWAERHPSQRHADAMDRTHLRVAIGRTAEQQRLIAREFQGGKLTTAQVAELEAAQGRIVAAEYEALRRGRERVRVAESIQHMQNVEDYAIRRDTGLAQAVHTA